ncbi:MAG: type IV pilus assembly protein PilM [Patescibacteria group bacterium]
MLFLNNSQFSVGLDISELSLKLVQLQKKGNKIKIQCISKVSLPSGLIVNGEIKNQEEIVKMIRKLIDKPRYGRITSDNVVACLPEKKTFIKLIEIKKTPNNLSDIIESEIEKHVPMLIDEIYYDWQVISDKEDVQQVLIGASPKNIVNQYTESLDRAGLSVEGLEIEPISLCRSLLSEESLDFKGPYNKNYAIIDMGATRTSMVVYSKNTILFTVSMPISGDEITKNIADSLEIEIDQAEKAKIVCGLDKSKANGVVYKILSGMINDLNNKVSKALEFYNNGFSDRGPIDCILLCGGGSNIEGIDEIIRQSVSTLVKKGDPLINLGKEKEKFIEILADNYDLNIKNKGSKLILKTDKNKKIEKEKNISIRQNSSLIFTTAIGLALRRIFIDRI